MEDVLDALIYAGFAESIRGTAAYSLMAVCTLLVAYKLLFWMIHAIGSVMGDR